MTPRPPLVVAATDLVRSTRSGAIWRRFALAPHLDALFGRLVGVVRRLPFGVIVDHFDMSMHKVAVPVGGLADAPPNDVALGAVIDAIPPEETP